MPKYTVEVSYVGRAEIVIEAPTALKADLLVEEYSETQEGAERIMLGILQANPPLHNIGIVNVTEGKVPEPMIDYADLHGE